ncbi:MULTISPECIES: PTS galactitol transporter subunit IIC [Clostridium]|uniref:PTS galactitol transporter subunit IIC n=2 Tax=Clostridium TaxID=1485 RepID=A0A0B5QG31_CLOBE|nr:MULTISPECIES: PTS galactitol transporter subunit IIC [Clostridium]AJG96937.1 PTS galactitol transporter subunit IIC [Clostridium beijerinckii]AQS02877.1 galactitol permease IIC component [Clostridium beijerinckii]AVK49272.1 PTS galactitol transporter subunit IIC [Clostridium sp. MF28]MBA2886388.1 PTS system galactitol-specific IIC component [Clostridium beijerinckii]MBA2901122.1 PTS system galactitol-specific IIC component [Clostridium beijerinckii]
MNNLMGVIQYVLGLGPTVILPIAILIIGLVFGIGLKKALKAGFTIGIGFVGINLVINLLTGSLGPAAQQMVERFGLKLTVLDTGWPSAAAGAWASPVAAILIPIIMGVNILMILTKTTKTLNIDIWNYWHFIAAGATGYILTNNWFFAIFCAVLLEVVTLFIADKTAPMIGNFYDLEGVSLPTASTASFAPLGFLVGYLVEKIPGLNKIKADPDTIQKKFGIFGEPMMMGIVIGWVLGILAGYDIGKTFNMGITMGAVMLLMPRMVKIIMEGLIPVSEAAREFLQKKYGDRELYIGLDAAVAVGHPAVISTALILVPITIFLAVILPGNKVLPFADLATIPFCVAFIVGSRKGNIVHSVITGTIVMAISLYMATDFAPVFTQMLASAQFKMPEGVALVSNIDTGGNLLNWLVLKLSQLVQPLFG